MSENSNTPTEARSPNPHQMYYRYRSVDENTMKKIVVIGGSIMLLILFALIFAVNMQNKNWNDSEKVIGFCISIAGLLIFSSILVSYSIHQLKKSAQRRRLVNSSANVSWKFSYRCRVFPLSQIISSKPIK